jgi:hypothetical protein
MIAKNSARRYDEGKLRLDLIPTHALKEVAKVYTHGAAKHHLLDEAGNVIEDGGDNWRRGLSWKKTIGSVKRHITEWESGQDYDPDPKMYGTFHLANAAWGLLTLLEYYKIAPEFDDRNHKYLTHKKIGLDIDEVICDWVGAWREKFGYDLPHHWHFSYNNKEHFQSMLPSELNEFYLNIPPKVDPTTLPFEPHCYITSRSVPTDLTEKWIQKHGFPTVPVYSVGFEESKVEVAKKSGIDIFVDDRFENFVELNKAGICCFLLDAPHNRKYDVGYKRIASLADLV